MPRPFSIGFKLEMEFPCWSMFVETFRLVLQCRSSTRVVVRHHVEGNWIQRGAETRNREDVVDRHAWGGDEEKGNNRNERTGSGREERDRQAQVCRAPRRRQVVPHRTTSPPFACFFLVASAWEKGGMWNLGAPWIATESTARWMPFYRRSDSATEITSRIRSADTLLSPCERKRDYAKETRRYSGGSLRLFRVH